MNAKRTLVSFLVIASVLFLLTTVSAASTVGITGTPVVKINGDEITSNPAVIAGDTISVKVTFTSSANASDVKIKATIEGNKADVTSVTSLFDVKNGNTYSKILTLKVPSDFEGSDLSQVLPLDVKIWNSDDDVSYDNSFDLTVQRTSYNIAVKSVITSNAINAGQSTPVDFVLKNIGYNNAQDVYVTVSIPELNIQKSAYLGDLVHIQDSYDDNEQNTVSGRIFLDVPYTAKAGVYTLSVSASVDEETTTATQDIAISNSVSDIAIKSGNDLIVLNPTNQLQVYTVKYNTNTVTVVVPAQSSKTVSIETPTAGDYKFDVAVYNGETLLSTVNYSGSVQASEIQLTNPVFVLTVILAIVFLVLLVVLVVLITKKPQKAEEFGESYY